MLKLKIKSTKLINAIHKKLIHQKITNKQKHRENVNSKIN